MVYALDGLKSVNNNLDYTKKMKNIGLRSLGAPYGPYGPSKDQKAPKLAK
jgi:hypothetical protein